MNIKRRVAIFDFDGTLTRGDTFLQFPMHALGRVATMVALLRGLPAIIGWKTGLCTNARAKERLTRLLYGGRNKHALYLQGMLFEPKWNRGVLQKLENHLHRGDTVWIVSASLDFWLLPIAKRLGVNLLCTITGADSQGNITGRFATPNCHGVEKLRRLLMVFPGLAVNREAYEVIVYGDEPSGGDSALSRFADHFEEVSTH